MRLERLVEVSWNDAWEDFDYDLTKTEHRVRTVGWLVRTKPVVSVAAERLEQGGWRGVTSIPRSQVRRIRRLKRR